MPATITRLSPIVWLGSFAFLPGQHGSGRPARRDVTETASSSNGRPAAWDLRAGHLASLTQTHFLLFATQFRQDRSSERLFQCLQ